MTEEQIIDDIIHREGGFVDHPLDEGGPTKFGITQFTLGRWRGKPASKNEVRDLFVGEARAIYRRMYIQRPGFSGIENLKLRALLIDSGVNHGPRDAIRFLQRSLKVSDDGVIGPITLGAVAGADPYRLYLRVVAQRIRYYGRIITDMPRRSVFAAGWANRAAEFVEAAP